MCCRGGGHRRLYSLHRLFLTLALNVSALFACILNLQIVLFTMELIVPTASRGIPLTTTWIAVEVMPEKHDLKQTQVQSEILDVRDESEDLI